MKTALLALLSSKKFLTTLLGTLTAIAAKYGLEVDPEIYWSIVGLTAVLVGAQGLNDHGKAKAEIETRHIQSGRIGLELLPFVLVFGAVVGVAACGWMKSETKHVAADLVDCTTAKAIELTKEFGPTVDQALLGFLSDTGQIDRSSLTALAKSYATDDARCVLAKSVARLLQGGGNDSQSSPLAVDIGDLGRAWNAVRVEEFGGKNFVLAGP